jgi:hypothetical protein
MVLLQICSIIVGEMIEEISEAQSINRHQFYFETPLYRLVPNTAVTESLHSGEVDAYSYVYKSPTTYAVYDAPVAENYYSAFKGYHRISLTNKRKEDDVLIFFVLQFTDGYMKVGQFPSLATIENSEITEKYSKYLEPADLLHFKKAVGLAAHGVGAGSLVYLRIIFECLINSTYSAYKEELKVSETQFNSKRMAEKVELLLGYLPKQLVEMKGVYNILSAGVHELTEQECLMYFQPLKLSIELILDQKIEDAVKREKELRVKQELRKITQAIKAKS